MRERERGEFSKLETTRDTGFSRSIGGEREEKRDVQRKNRWRKNRRERGKSNNKEIARRGGGGGLPPRSRLG